MINSYIPEKIEATDAVYEQVFGSTDKTESFNWLEYLPYRERQYRVPLCVIYSRLDCAEAVAKKNGLDINFSELRLGFEVRISKKGTTFNKVSEYFRKIGTDLEEDTPMDQDVLKGGWSAWSNITRLPPAGDRYKGGSHSWVRTEAGMMDALEHSPLQIAVRENNKNWEANGEVQNPTHADYGHAVLLYHIDRQGRKLVRDSVGKEFKILNKDYPIKWCKSFRDLPNNWKESMQNEFIKIIKDKNSKSTGFFIPATSEQAFESMSIAFGKPVIRTIEGKINWDEMVEGEFELN